jgi:hypothetical protein
LLPSVVASVSGEELARTRTTKKLAQRVDLNYFKRPTPYKRARLLLVVLAPLLAVGWIAWRGFTRDSRVYSSGRLSRPHAVLERQCAACHVAKAGAFSSAAADSACLACHDGPLHHENEVAANVPTCATCHREHRGRIQLSAASDQSCAECHVNLKGTGPIPTYATHIRSLADGHPEFTALRDGTKNPATIRLNHAIHMKAIRRGPNGPIVQLECGDCHRPAALNAPWPYEDKAYALANASYSTESRTASPRDVLAGPKSLTGREAMLPVKFATACAGCHLLTFDKRFDKGVPHDTTEVVHAFLVKKFREYIAAHPGEVRVVREPQRELTGKLMPTEVRVLTPSQWVAERTADAEELLWRKTCKQCHSYDARLPGGGIVNTGATLRSEESSLPKIEASRVTERWLPHAKFDHNAHRGFSCTGCHTKALTSAETGDILVPGIANCKTCHAPGPEHAESRCFECHIYHDWSKRKEVKATFTLPALRSRGK